MNGKEQSVLMMTSFQLELTANFGNALCTEGLLMSWWKLMVLFMQALVWETEAGKCNLCDRR